MFREYNPITEKLVSCPQCHIVYIREEIKIHTRDDEDNKISFLECPNCGYEEKVDYND